jgi:hypothetical protein
MTNAQLAAKVAAQIEANVAALNTREIDCAEFSRRQFAAWDAVIGKPRAADMVRAAIAAGV